MIVVVHCFFDCGHVVRDPDSQAAHDRMETHYSTDHAEQLARLIERGTPCPSKRR